MQVSSCYCEHQNACLAPCALIKSQKRQTASSYSRRRFVQHQRLHLAGRPLSCTTYKEDGSSMAMSHCKGLQSTFDPSWREHETRSSNGISSLQVKQSTRVLDSVNNASLLNSCGASLLRYCSHVSMTTLETSPNDGRPTYCRNALRAHRNRVVTIPEGRHNPIFSTCMPLRHCACSV